MESGLTGWADPVQRQRSALEDNEFELYCQPILQFSGTERYPMAEVLVRLREEERALLPPGDFLPVFEHYRMMPELDRWVVRHTLLRLAQGSRIPRFTVNVSGQTLEDAEFLGFVAGELASSRVPPQNLLFEIDESDMLGRPEAAGRFAAAAKSVGTRLLIDGFGRRAVSFAPVAGLRPHFLKVDGRLTRKVVTSEAVRGKMSAMLQVGAKFGFGLIAECVEEQDVLLRLRGMGFGYAQGFGIYQPHPIATLATTV